MKMTTHDLVLCALCAAVTCILAPLSVPLAGEVPISLATFAVLLSGILLGAKLGGLSQVIYVLLGSVGVPVFAVIYTLLRENAYRRVKEKNITEI